MKNYIRGTAKQAETKFGKIINLTLNVDDLKKLPIYKGYWRLSVAERKEVGQYGDTHYVYENDFVWEPQETASK